MVSEELTPTLVVASGNQHKVREIEVFLQNTQRFKAVIGVRDFSDSLPNIEETGRSFMENAAIKAVGWAQWLKEQGLAKGDWVLADDSGICIDALDGKPGIVSARFAGNQATDKMNNDLVVSEMKRRDLEWSDAHYVCAIAVVRVDFSTMHFGKRTCSKAGPERGSKTSIEAKLMEPQSRAEIWKDPRMLQVCGRCNGEISVHFRGSGGFGYDPHFWIDQRGQTFAELDPSEKSKRSHRGEALRIFAQCLSSTNFG